MISYTCLSEESSDGHEKLDCISKEKLSDALRFFFHEVRKQNGDRYPGETLRQLFFGIQRYIRFERRLDWQLMTDPLFLDCRDALDTAMKIYTSKGLSLNRKIPAPISSELEEELWGKKLLGSDCPKKLTRTLLYLISINCGLRGGQELRQLKWGEGSQLTLQKLPDGTTEQGEVECVLSAAGMVNYEADSQWEKCHTPLARERSIEY